MEEINKTVHTWVWIGPVPAVGAIHGDSPLTHEAEVTLRQVSPQEEVWVRSLQWLTEPLLGEQEDIELGSSGWTCLGSSREFPGREQGGPRGMCIPLEMLPSILHIILAVPYRTGFKIVLEITFLCGIIHTASGVCHVFFPP